jgi:hypothetical protein
MGYHKLNPLSYHKLNPPGYHELNPPGGHELMTRRAVLAVVAGLLAGGCTGSRSASAHFEDGGVAVVAVLDAGQVRVTFSPRQPGFHLYSIDLPPQGVQGLGIPTAVTVRGALSATGRPAADAPVHDLRIDLLDVDLPVYPDGPVTVTVPVRRSGHGHPEVLVSYGACSATTCLVPVRNHLVTLDR